jgi:hypothetical protein
VDDIDVNGLRDTDCCDGHSFTPIVDLNSPHRCLHAPTDSPFLLRSLRADAAPMSPQIGRRLLMEKSLTVEDPIAVPYTICDAAADVKLERLPDKQGSS